MSDEKTGDKTDVIDIQQIMEMIPHRFPMLLIDRIVEIENGVRVHAIKNVSINEPQFQGHFPVKAIMPGVMIVEAMAQAAGVLVVNGMDGDAEGKLVYFMSIDGCRFRRPVVPGDTMHIHVDVDRNRGAVWRFKGKAFVDDQLATEATFSAMIVDQ
jgi:3-hydroxyacyl-[acyl-carrier-protein] dehydratase